MKSIEISSAAAKDRRTRPVYRRRWGWRHTLVAVGASVTLCFVLLSVLATTVLRPPRVVGLVAVGAHYAENLHTPHNAWGWNGLKAACGLPGRSESLRIGEDLLLKCQATPTLADDCFAWQDALDQLDETASVLLVSLHGGADEQGAYLLRSGANPSDAPGRLLRVDQLLEDLRSLPKGRLKLVIFDATQVARLGQFSVVQNHFAEGLRLLNDAILSDPSLVVISASSPGERSWIEPALGRTIFLNSLAEGLSGAAHDFDQNGRTSGEELINYLRSVVKSRAESLHRREQNVMVLPAGEEAQRRLARFDLSLVNPDYRPSPDLPTDISPHVLKSQSERIEGVAKFLKLPTTVAPIAWRRLRLLQLRHEQLLAAGAPELAEVLAHSIASLAGELEVVAARLAGESDPVQLVRAPEGYPLRTAIDPLLAKLVASPADNARSLWAQEDGRINASELESVRRQIYDRLLQGFLDSPVDRLQQTANLIRAISPRSTARPAEAHLLVMLAEGLPHDLDEARWNHPLKVAIQTRLHAEQVYADGDFVEQILSAAIYGWIKLCCDAADQLRREGEDLLFCGEDYLERAEHALEKADAIYTKLRSDATELRRAVTVRDQAFSLLSRYSEAVANLVNTSDEDRKELLALRQSVEKAWQSAHTLGDLLAVENVGKDEPHSGIQTVVGLRSQLELTLGGLRMQMQAWTADLIERSGPAFWNNRDATLLAPEIEMSQRLQLLSVTPPSAEQAPMDQRGMTLSGSTLSRWRSEEAVRGARLAMAAVGQQRFDQSLHERQGYAAQMKRLKAESFSDVADRDTALAEVEAGLRTINRVRRRLALQAARLVADGQQDSLGFAVVADAADTERRLSSGADGHEGPHPSSELTKVQLYRFLLARADRAISDGWNCESSGAVPYYRRAAGAYLKRADGLLAGREATDRLKRIARTPVVLNVSSASRVNIVSGIAPPISYSVDASLPGTAAVAVRCANGLRVLNTSPSERRAVDIGGVGNNGLEVVVGVDRTGIAVGADAPSNETLRLSFDVWMRGHTATRDTDIVVYHRPDSQMTLPPPNNSAGVTMVTDETVRKALGDAGGVAFVLDASGSMGPADETLASKYVQAVESLNSMLADLPAGVRVSVWVFGQAVGTQKTVGNAEATIQQVLSPVVWDPNDQRLRRRLAARIAYPRVEPWNESPLGRAILAAASDLRGVRGYKSIVAITDGMDNRFVTDGVANPLRTSLGDVLGRELAGSGISLQVIGFRVTAAEQAEARRQFAFLSSLSPPGRWWEAEQRRDLDEAMRASFHQGQVLLLAPSGSAEAIEPIIANVSGQDKPHDWQSTRLSPGTYTIQPSSSSTDDIASKVLLKGGDLMLLSVKQSGGRPTIVPASYASLCMAGKPAHETSDWRATLVGRRRLPNSALSSLVTLERKWKSPPDEGKILQVIRPKDVWVESLGDTGGGVNWNSLHGYPAPCWELMQTGSSLHGVDSPFTMWWIGDGQCPASLTLRRRRDFSTIGELAGRKLDINGVSVAISRVAVELHALPDPTGALVEQSSLVVELGAPQPFLVDLSGVSVAGRELQLFKEAGRCVTRFWPLSDDQLAAALRGIEITAVADLKRIAEIHKQTVTFDELSPASPSEPRPLPAVGWLGASVD